MYGTLKTKLKKNESNILERSLLRDKNEHPIKYVHLLEKKDKNEWRSFLSRNENDREDIK